MTCNNKCIIIAYISNIIIMALGTITFRPSRKNKLLIKKLKDLANKENRTLNNYIETVLTSHINNK